MTTYVDGIPYLETRNIGRGIAHARVEINKSTKEVANVTGEVDTTPYLYQGLTEHAEVKKLCAIYNEKIDPIKHEVIGTTNGELDISDTFSLTDLCVDTMSQVAKEWAKNNGGVTITAAFHNANGGVRAKIAAGNITYGDVYKSFPFDNEICIVKTTGTKLKNYFRKSQAYGVWRDTTLTALADIDADKDYYFTTTDFMATSDSFVFKLKDSDLIRTGEVVRDTIAARIKKDKTISAESFRRSSNVQFQPLVR